MKKGRSPALICLAIVAFHAGAEQRDWYVQGAGGKSRYEIGTSRIKSGEASAGLAVGYSTSPHLSFEAGVFDLGAVNANQTAFTARGGQFTTILSAPLAGVFSVYGRGGVSLTDRKVTYLNQSNRDLRTEAIYGLGLGCNIVQRVDATVEYQRLENSRVESVNVGLRVNL